MMTFMMPFQTEEKMIDLGMIDEAIKLFDYFHHTTMIIHAIYTAASA